MKPHKYAIGAHMVFPYAVLRLYSRAVNFPGYFTQMLLIIFSFGILYNNNENEIIIV